MTGAEKGFLLLSSQLGDPLRRPLSGPQLRNLGRLVRSMQVPEADRELAVEDLVKLGLDSRFSARVVNLLEEEALLENYLWAAKLADCIPIPRINSFYPANLRERLGDDSPGCLWAKGDLSLLHTPCIGLVGSRDLRTANKAFAERVGIQAARQGKTLVSGNARGADRIAQQACLVNGGKVIVVVADALTDKKPGNGELYISENSFELPFSAQRALSRNRIIHCLGQYTFVAQCGYREGGTWSGTHKNLQHNWSPVFCLRDGSPAAELLEQMGAVLIQPEELEKMDSLSEWNLSVF